VLRSLLYNNEFDINVILNSNRPLPNKTLYSFVNGKFVVEGEPESTYTDANDILLERINKDKNMPVSRWTKLFAYLNNFDNVFL
jgi:hypothetical protein